MRTALVVLVFAAAGLLAVDLQSSAARQDVTAAPARSLSQAKPSPKPATASFRPASRRSATPSESSSRARRAPSAVRGFGPRSRRALVFGRSVTMSKPGD
jgi:hypothetical protein